MLDQILSSVKGELSSKMTELGLPSDKADDAVAIAKDDVLDVFKKEATGGNMAGILNLFNGKESIGSSSLVSSLVTQYGGSLISKLGLNPTTANMIAKFSIPFIMNKINDDSPDDGIGESGLAKMIGGGIMDSLGDSLKDKLGGLFG
ncbi:MAG: hypothetical protein AAFN93_00135 [Bacteroidota bacterium]